MAGVRKGKWEPLQGTRVLEGKGAVEESIEGDMEKMRLKIVGSGLGFEEIPCRRGCREEQHAEGLSKPPAINAATCSVKQIFFDVKVNTAGGMR